MAKRCLYYFGLVEILSDHASVQPQVSSDQMQKSKATPTCTSPRGALCKTNYLQSDSLDEEKSDENTSLDNQEREEVAEAFTNARSVIGALERGKSMKEDEDEAIKEKHEDSSFVQT